MKPTNKMLLISSVNVSIFWIGILSQPFERTHSLEEALKSTLSPVTLLITLALFLSPFVLYTFKKKQMEEILEVNEDEDYKNAINALLFSPSALTIRVKHALNLTEEMFGLKGAIVVLYENNTINLIAKSNNASACKISEQIQPLKAIKSNLEEIVSLCYVEKRISLEQEIVIDNNTHYVYAQALQTKNAMQPFGLALYIAKKPLPKDKLPLLSHLSETIAFCTNVIHKKDDIYQKSLLAQEATKEYDESLNIYTLNKLQNSIEYEINRNARHKTNLTLVLMEIDHFKNLCNIFDDIQSDTILKEFINFIKSNIRATDIFGKWNEERFAFVIPDQDFKAGIDMSKRLLELLKNKHFSKVGKLTCSFGVTSYFRDKDNPSSFKVRASDALEKAKINGGNGVDSKLLI